MDRVILTSLKFAIIVTAVLCPFRSSFGESMTIGFPEFERDLNIADSTHPLARFLRSAVTSPLMSLGGGKEGVSQEASTIGDYLKVNSDYSNWSFRIRQALKFSNGDPIQPRDVIYSLSRCAKSGRLKGYIGATEKKSSDRFGNLESWIEIKVSNGSSSLVKVFSDQLSQCSIYNSDSTLKFGDDFGKGANLITIGTYVISDLVFGKRYQIERVSKELPTKKSVAVFSLKGFDDQHAALNSLRVGGLSGMYASDIEVLANAKKDETLTVDKCLDEYSVIYRKGVVLPCLDKMNVIEIRDLG